MWNVSLERHMGRFYASHLRNVIYQVHITGCFLIQLKFCQFVGKFWNDVIFDGSFSSILTTERRRFFVQQLSITSQKQARGVQLTDPKIRIVGCEYIFFDPKSDNWHASIDKK